MGQNRYPIGAVAKMTGLGLDRLRAWERRYGAVEPGRGARGRLYTAAEVQRLILLREAVENGHPIGEVVRLNDESLRELLRDFRSSARGENAPGVGDVNGRLLRAIERLDYAELNSQLSRIAVVLRPREVVYDVVLPLIRIVGKGWEEGRIGVAQEHMLSAVLRDLLGSLVRITLPTGVAPAVLFATPAGELHEFGILTAALLATGSGSGIVYLGVNLPAGEIAAAATRSGAKAIVLGVAEPEPPRSVRRAIARIARDLPAGTELWVGAPAAALATLSIPGLVHLTSFDIFEQQLRRFGGIPAPQPDPPSTGSSVASRWKEE